MRLSDQREYLTAIPAAADGDFATARANLATLIERGRVEHADEQVAYLTHVLADVEARAGNLDRCHFLHASAIEMFPDVPLSYIHYATTLIRRLGERERAFDELMKAERLLGTERWRMTGDDLPEHWYREEIEKLRSEADKK